MFKRAVDLKQSAVVTGDIAAQHISTDEGAYFMGRVNIQKEASKKEGSEVTASSSKGGCSAVGLGERRERR